MWEGIITEQIRIPRTQSKEQYLKRPPEERELYVREILRQTVNMNQYGVTVGSLTRSLPFDPRTVEKHLSILVHTNEIYGVKVGSTTLYLPNSRTMRPLLEETLPLDGKKYSVSLLQNRLGDFISIQEKTRSDYSENVSGGILVPLMGYDQFVQYLQKGLARVKKTKGEQYNARVAIEGDEGPDSRSKRRRGRSRDEAELTSKITII